MKGLIGTSAQIAQRNLIKLSDPESTKEDPARTDATKMSTTMKASS